MKIIVCKQNLYGGTDKLLERLAVWLAHYYTVDVLELGQNLNEKRYDLAIIPSSQLGDLWMLKKEGITVDKVLVWILGTGAFYESYYNETQNVGINRVIIKYLKKEVSSTLAWLYNHNSIIFTDEVGAYNTFKNESIDYKKNLDHNLIPIAIEISDNLELRGKNNNKDIIRIAWIGRVSTDFKYIPIKHLIEDLKEWSKCHKERISLTIIGTGDAIFAVKEICGNIKFSVTFIDEIEYEKLASFILEKVDLLVAMGTSALDGAKVGCPTMIITPVRQGDVEEVYYRWIYESKGYSLGEFPKIGNETDQVKKELSEMLEEYMMKDEQSYRSYEYAKNFAVESVFPKLKNRELPHSIDKKMWKHIRFFYYFKLIKNKLKRYYK